MNYSVLARKWRPHNFSTLVGQEHVSHVLKNSLKQQRLHHAYLFTGTRGVGKTTIARIFAKALNCEAGIGAEPCETCQTCQDIAAGRCLDLLEIDAASRTKVEDTRELLENIQYAPTRCRFKIYIIDEVHMLSGHSFNALLKTLEEPPEHVKFLLATTDPQKLPVTVLSRCLQFNLKNMLPEQITAHLAYILDQEHIAYEKIALDLIATAAEGSMRDALSLLDQAIAYGSQTLAETDVRQMLGYVESTILIRLLTALAQQDPESILNINRELLIQGADFHRILAELQEYLHHITLLQCVPDSNFIAQPLLETLTPFARHFSAQDIQLFYQIALKGRHDLTLAPTPLIGFDMTLLRMLAFKPATEAAQPPLSYQSKIDAPQLDFQQGADFDSKRSVLNTHEHAHQVHSEDSRAPSMPPQSCVWETIITQLSLTGLAQNLVQHCILLQYDQQQMTLALEPTHETLLTPAIRQRIEIALQQHLGKPITIHFEISTDTLDSPARKQKQLTEQYHSEAKEKLHHDPKLHKIITAFDAKLVEDSLEVLK